MLASVIAAASLFTGCTDESKPDTGSQHDTDSSYYGVNYTDTGDSGDNFGNSSANVDYSSVVSKENASSERSSSPENSASSKAASSGSSRRNSSGTLTKTVITYYYFDEEGEHTTDTEIYTDADVVSEVSSEEQSSTVSEEPVTDPINSDTDTSTDSELPLIESEGAFTEEDLTFSYNGTVIVFDRNIEDVVKAIGEPLSIESVPNPENTEFDRKIYNYDQFSIDTEPSGDGTVYTTVGLQIFDESIKTDKGVYIGMSAKDAVSIYGGDMMICGDEYRYYIGSRYMYLYVTNEIVANIGYAYDKDMIPTD